jgi:TonB family protein
LTAAKKTAIQACYDRSDARKQGKSGRLVVRMFITARGVAIQVKVIESEVGDEKLNRCIVETIKKWRSPAHGGPAVRVELPFVFASKT